MARDSSWEQLGLCTDRLCLRAPTPHDAEALYDLFADEEIMGGLNREPVSAVEQARAVIEEGMGGWRTDGLGPFILQTRGTDRRVVGQAGLMIFDTRGWTPSTWAQARSHARRVGSAPRPGIMSAARPPSAARAATGLFVTSVAGVEAFGAAEATDASGIASTRKRGLFTTGASHG